MNKFGKAFGLLDFLISPRKDIEIFGMFGPGNLGDEAMLVAASKTLSAGRCTPSLSYAYRPVLKELIGARRRKHLLVAGGTLIHGGTGKKTAWLDYIEMRSRQGTQVSFFGTGMAFTPDQIAGKTESYRRWCAVLDRSHEIHLRGPKSVALCQHMGARADIFGDFAFLLHRADISVRDHGRRDEIIGINVGNCLGDQDLFDDGCVALIGKLVKRYRLVFYVVVNTDMAATRRVISRAGLSESDYEIQTHYFDPDAFMQSIRNHRAFIGLKLHAAGLAMVAGVPALMIAYRPKSFDFMAPLDAGDHMVMTLPLDIELTVSRVEDMLQDPQKFVVEDKIAAIAAVQRKTLDRVYSMSSAAPVSPGQPR